MQHNSRLQKQNCKRNSKYLAYIIKLSEKIVECKQGEPKEMRDIANKGKLKRIMQNGKFDVHKRLVTCMKMVFKLYILHTWNSPKKHKNKKFLDKNKLNTKNLTF